MSNPRRDHRHHAPGRLLAHLAVGLGLAVAPGAWACDDGAHLDVLTLNAWGLPAPLAPHRPRRMAALASWLDGLDVDVVGLQEIWTGAVRHLATPISRAHDPGDDGLALRGAPGVVVEALRFDRARGFDAWKRKGAIRMQVDTASGPVWVVDTHLQAGRGEANGQVRAAQLAQLVAWLAHLEGPVVLLGDLNVDERHPEDALALARVAQAGFRDVATTLHHAEPTYLGDGRRYDRILVRDGTGLVLEAEQVAVIAYDDDPATPAPTRLSDHQPLRARLRLVARR